MILFVLKLSTLSSSSGLYVLPCIHRGTHTWTLNYSRHFFPSPPNICLFILWLKKNPQSFIIADLHTNSVHIKHLLQKVGGLMNATVSSVLTQFFLIHIQLCAPSPLPHDPNTPPHPHPPHPHPPPTPPPPTHTPTPHPHTPPPTLRDSNSVSAETFPPVFPQIPEPSPLIQLITTIDMQPA